MTQYAVPERNLVVTGWEKFPDTDEHWEKVDEGIDGGSPDDGTTYVSNTDTGEPLVFGLGNIIDPGVHTGHIIKIRGSVRGGGFPADAGALVLRQGPSIVIASTGVQEVGFGGSWTTFVLSLTATEAAMITNYKDLRAGYNQVLGNGTMRITAMEFQCPDADPQEPSYPALFLGPWA